MSTIVMNILAYLAIIALLGFIGVVIWAVASVKALINKAKSTTSVINAPRQSILQIVGIVKGIGLKSKERFIVIGGHVKVAADSVAHAKTEIVDVVGSIDVQGAKAGAEEAASRLRPTAQTANLVSQVFATWQAAKRS